MALNVPSPGGGSAPPRSMAHRLWGLDWTSILPWTLEEVRVGYERYDDVQAFIARLYPDTFNVDRQWLQEPMTDAKRRFGEEMDYFTFRTDEKIVGVLAGHPTDWSTYYWRTVAFLPEYRGRHILTSFADRCWGPFREVGVKRIELDTCPANRAGLKVFTNQGFIVTSTVSSERWGLTLRMTKFLDEDAERVFTRQFLDVPATSTSERSRP